MISFVIIAPIIVVALLGGFVYPFSKNKVTPEQEVADLLSKAEAEKAKAVTLTKEEVLKLKAFLNEEEAKVGGLFDKVKVKAKAKAKI